MNSSISSSQYCHHLMDIKKTSEYLGCTVNTLYSWASQKRIPYVKIGRLLKFSRQDIDHWIEEHKVKPFEYK